jgi:uncharacterized protein YkwD
MTAGRTRRSERSRSAAQLATALAVVCSVVLGPTAVVAGASATTAARPAAPLVSIAGFLQSINNLRASLGLGGLQSSSQLDAIAQHWSEQMAAAGGISHNPNLAAEVGPDGWSLLGENVGVGWDVLGLMNAFIASPHHYENLVNPQFDFVGIGEVILPDGRLFTTHVFMASDSTPAPAPVVQVTHSRSPSTTTTAPAPAPTTTTTAPPPPPPPPPAPKPTPARVAAVLDVLRTLDPTATP